MKYSLSILFNPSWRADCVQDINGARRFLSSGLGSRRYILWSQQSLASRTLGVFMESIYISLFQSILSIKHIDHLFHIIIPLLVVLQRHIRAIVYQELYNVTTPFPVLRTRYSMSFTCWVPCWYNQLRLTWPHSEGQLCCCYLKRQFRS